MIDHKKILINVLVVMILSASAYASEAKYNFLLQFFDLNESALAYHRHCLSASEDVNPAFIKNMDLVANELLERLRENYPDINADYMKTKILERRYQIQYRLDSVSIKNGCNTPEIDIARNHYEEVSHFTHREIIKMIDGL